MCLHFGEDLQEMSRIQDGLAYSDSSWNVVIPIHCLSHDEARRLKRVLVFSVAPKACHNTEWICFIFSFIGDCSGNF